MEQQAVEYNNNICNDNSEVYADILSGDENNITSESDESDIIISGKVLPIESNSEKSDSDDEFNNDEFIGNDFFELLVKETNRCHLQNVNKYKYTKKIKQWEDTTIDEMKKFLALNILMGQVNKSNLNDYWSTAKQNLSLDEAMTPHRGRLSFRVYNPGKKSKYGMLVRLLCESESAYITNFKLYNGNGQKLQNLVEDVLENYANIWHHVYMDNYYYSSVELAANLLEKKIRQIGTMQEEIIKLQGLVANMGTYPVVTSDEEHGLVIQFKHLEDFQSFNENLKKNESLNKYMV
ncbi:uncharacterized protein LOC113390747 [Ctenocephalides felis]|uniref:uncharacterized protein LOC113390747 n=1 Tax=Ctenocephalides felis TaxID=7515 RepID=UPI000E6E14A3|nr:uncharacterized protein LOC113390747 [Ctenocephalides felis]